MLPQTSQNLSLSHLHITRFMSRPSKDRKKLTHPSVQAPVLNCLGDMFDFDLIASLYVRDGSRCFQDAIICPGGKTTAVYGRFHETLDRCVILCCNELNLDLRAGCLGDLFQGLERKAFILPALNP